jgi:hypothetical protein
MLEKPNKSKIECACAVLKEVVAHLEKSGEPTPEAIIPGAPPSDDLSPAGEAARADLVPEQ